MPDASDHSFTIGIPVYDEVDLLDVCAPCEIFSWMGEKWKGRPGGRSVEIFLTAETVDPTRPITTRDGVQLIPHKTFAELPCLDLLFVPGGGLEGLVATGNNDAYMKYLKATGAKADWVTSVCEGALLLANSGLLDGYRVTTHWAFKECLGLFKHVTVVDGYPRYVVDRNRVTGGGISAGLDECMALVEIITGDSELARDVRRSIQYFPTPVEQDLPKPPGCPIKDLKNKWKIGRRG